LRAYLLFAVLAVLFPVPFISPFGGLLVYTWISIFNPHQYTFGFMRGLPVALAFAVPTIIGLLFTARRRWPPITRETILLTLLWCWFGITTLNVYFSPTLQHHWDDTLQKLIFVSKILLMIFVSLMVVIDAKRLRLWYLVTAGCFAFFALKSAIFGIITGGQYRIYGPPNSMLADNNDFGLAMNMALPMFLCFSKTESKALRWIFRAAIPMGMLAVVLTFSRGDMLGLMFLLLVWAMKSRYKVLGAMGVLVAVTLVFATAPETWIERMRTISTAPQTDASAQSRIRAWTFAVDLARDHPVFGGGFETFTVPLYEHYGVEDTHGPHSIYFQMLGEHGVPGLLIFLGLILSCYWSCRQIIRRFRDDGSEGYWAEYARMVQLSLATYLVCGAFLGRGYFDLFYQIVATVIILKSLARTAIGHSPNENLPQEELPVLAAEPRPIST
jgi:probable O-glycosylation ligase (exosortase A-associated)